MDLVQADYKGERWLSLPFMKVNDYLAVPREIRWTFYLAAAICMSRSNLEV